jgi:hypothetical protein
MNEKTDPQSEHCAVQWDLAVWGLSKTTRSVEPHFGQHGGLRDGSSVCIDKRSILLGKCESAWQALCGGITEGKDQALQESPVSSSISPVNSGGLFLPIVNTPPQSHCQAGSVGGPSTPQITGLDGTTVKSSEPQRGHIALIR